MKKLRVALLLLAATCSSSLFAQSRAQIEAYIAQFKDIAMAEMARTGVPAAITLAQGIHETGAGTSDLVLKSNNHFGIKCKTEWDGEKVYHDDDAKGECFRKYDDPFVSYKDHSDFLRNRPFYAALFKLDPTDYEAWAFGLKKAGYATNPKYPQILIKLIQDYNLQDYTLIVLGKKERNENDPAWTKASTEQPRAVTAKNSEVPAVKHNYPAGVFTINETKVIFITKGTSYLKVATEQNISLGRLLEFNDLQDGDVAREDGLLFLQRKRKTGANDTHIVAAGETLYQIAQAEGIRLESLLRYNFLTANVQVLAGEKLYLRDKAPAMPRLAGERVQATTVSTESSYTAKEAPKASLAIMHVVQPKDTVYSIARKYEVGVDEVKKWNEMETTDLKIGQQIKINKTR
ncbi:glucosaminidase domain-containing protein [Flavisolibacter nicotianae]|uniref:glucosaminidase domain-containing protein n=1 Tax=Flavisolibacter nicotianae TaxID=2364882 RepID=UPI000EAF08B0|nr:glucosaminidase domain-containing protein [Flavisolibacter nicotianae]